MGYVQIKEPVEMLAHFSPQGVIRPLAFSWGKRMHKVLRTTYRWHAGRGRAALHYFAVVTKSEDAFQLCYRDEDATWWLEKTWTQD
jgi:hypothetical protein